MPAPTETRNIYEYGVKNVVIAFHKTDGTFETPVKLEGVTGLKIALDASQDVLNADDGVWAIIRQTSKAELTLKSYMTLPKAIRRRIFGRKVDPNGIGYLTNAPVPEEFALGFEFEGVAQNYRRWFYRNTAAEQDDDRSTTGDKVEAAEHETAITATPFDVGSEKILCSEPIASIDDKAVYDTYFEKVYVASATAATISQGA